LTVRTDLSDQIHELMERGLRPVSVADIGSSAPARMTARPRAGRMLAPRPGWRRLAVGAAAAVAAIAVTLALTTSGSPGRAGRRAGRPAPTGPALATAYVVHRVENAVANDNRVMRETRSLDDPSSGGAGFFDGQLSAESVTWTYQGRNSTEIFGTHGQLQAISGTGIVNGKLQGVQVDYIHHQWGLMPGAFFTSPANACTNAGFMDAPGDPGTNWPLLIARTLACGGFKMTGYAYVGGAETVKISGSRVIGAGSAEVTNALTLFVSPSTYLPVRVTLTLASPGLHTSWTSFGFQWLSPTAANRARASVTVPCGYQEINWSSGKPVSGERSRACG
jgi:hypothetical protein